MGYDTQHLYKALGARGQQLLTPLKRIAVNPAPLRRMGPHRRLAIALRERLGGGYRALPDLRDQIEHIFPALTCFGGGLTVLPAWVRRIRPRHPLGHRQDRDLSRTSAPAEAGLMSRLRALILSTAMARVSIDTEPVQSALLAR